MAQNELNKHLTENLNLCEPSHESSRGSLNIADLRSNREYQSTVFTSYFSAPENAAKLYEGLAREYDLGEKNLQEPASIPETGDTVVPKSKFHKCDGSVLRQEIPVRTLPDSTCPEIGPNDILQGARTNNTLTEIRPDDIVFETLAGVLYMARKNDLAFTVKHHGADGPTQGHLP